MLGARTGGLIAATIVIVTGCSAVVDTAEQLDGPRPVAAAGSRTTGTDPASVEPPATDPPISTTTVAPTTTTTVVTAPPITTAAPSPSTTTDPPTAVAATTTIPATTTTTSPTSMSTIVPAAPDATDTNGGPDVSVAVPVGVYDPACVAPVADGESLATIAARYGDALFTTATLAAENQLDGDAVEPGRWLDVCIDNGRDDITGAERTERNPAVVELEALRAVEAQQTQLNKLFDGYGIRELAVDGDSGPVTRQRLCAFRLAAGLAPSTVDMVPGSEEEQLLMAAETLPIPFSSAILSDRWILIDRTCQVMFVGEGAERLRYVFPTSTGHAGFSTRSQNRTPAYRFNSANHNGGWHNSTTYPAADDNPLNGNMYRPLYFDRGQAIHGANNVPRSPASKGCARLRVGDQDTLLAWLGLAGSGSTSNRGRINVTVNVQGRWAGN